MEYPLLGSPDPELGVQGWKGIHMTLDLIKQLYFYNRFQLSLKEPKYQGGHIWSGYGSVCRAVASDTRDPRIESSHRQDFHWLYLLLKRRK